MDIDDAYLEVLIEMDIDDAYLEVQTVDNDDLFSTPKSNRGMNPSVGCSCTIDKGKGKSALGGNGKGCFKITKREYLAQFRRQRNIISMPQSLSAATANKTKAAFRPNGSSKSSYRNDVRVMASPRTETEEESEATAHRLDEKMGSSCTIVKGKGKSALGGNGKGCFKRTKREYLAQFRRQRNSISMPQSLSAATANQMKAAFRRNGSSKSSYRTDVRVMASPRTETEEESEATAHRPDEKMGSSTSAAQSRASLERREERVRIMEEIVRLLEEGKLVFL